MCIIHKAQNIVPMLQSDNIPVILQSAICGLFNHLRWNLLSFSHMKKKLPGIWFKQAFDDFAELC